MTFTSGQETEFWAYTCGDVKGPVQTRIRESVSYPQRCPFSLGCRETRGKCVATHTDSLSVPHMP